MKNNTPNHLWTESLLYEILQQIRQVRHKLNFLVTLCGYYSDYLQSSSVQLLSLLYLQASVFKNRKSSFVALVFVKLMTFSFRNMIILDWPHTSSNKHQSLIWGNGFTFWNSHTHTHTRGYQPRVFLKTSWRLDLLRWAEFRVPRVFWFSWNNNERILGRSQRMGSQISGTHTNTTQKTLLDSFLSNILTFIRNEITRMQQTTQR